jgi:acyl-CoA synthetase (AMP-forming)/AMP-acid ligase II
MSDDNIPGRRLIGAYSVRWDPNRAQAAYADGWWVGETLADASRRAAEDDPGRILVVEGDALLTSRMLYAQAHSLAQALLARAPAGSAISFMLPNWHEAAVIYLAITLAGMVAHPILPSLRDHELLFMLRDISARAIFIPAAYRNHDYVAMLDRVVPQLEPRPDVVVLRGDADTHTSFANLLTSAPVENLPPLEADAVRLILYTSGTTGSPKGVLHSHNSIYALMRQIGQNWLVEPGDTFLVPSPISHIGGSIYAFEGPLLLGTKAVLMERWDPETALHLVNSEACTHICGATPFLEQLLDAARRAGQKLPSLKLFVCGGASVPPSLIRNATAYFEKAAFTRVYGSTEVPVTTVGCPDRADLAHAAETDGRPGIATVKLGPSPNAASGEGEILARGPQMLMGYVHAKDEITVFDADGFYRTGDLGRWVEGNYLVISGRAKDIIIRNGENISPKEIEDILLDHPQIAEIAIVGVPDPRTGERASAVIVPTQPPGPDIASLRAFLTERGVATFKFPEEVVLWDSLPKNDTGKVLKHRIRADLVSRPAGK